MRVSDVVSFTHTTHGKVIDQSGNSVLIRDSRGTSYWIPIERVRVRDSEELRWSKWVRKFSNSEEE